MCFLVVVIRNVTFICGHLQNPITIPYGNIQIMSTFIARNDLNMMHAKFVNYF